MKTKSSDLLRAAKFWTKQGVSVVPVLPLSKVCIYQWRCYENVLPDQTQLLAWFLRGGNNLAVVCGTGKTGSLLVLDFDQVDQAEAFKVRAGALAITYIEASARGLHFFYFVDTPVNKAFIEGESLGLGHLCMAWPSLHPSIKPYERINDLSIREVETSALFSLLTEKEREVDKPCPRLESKNDLVRQDDLVSRVKAAYNIVDLAATLTQLKHSGGAGRYYVGRCPFHQDIKPSFWVDQTKGLFGCFSPSCKAHRPGDFINLYCMANNLPIREGLRILARSLNG